LKREKWPAESARMPGKGFTPPRRTRSIGRSALCSAFLRPQIELQLVSGFPGSEAHPADEITKKRSHMFMWALPGGIVNSDLESASELRARRPRWPSLPNCNHLFSDT